MLVFWLLIITILLAWNPKFKKFGFLSFLGFLGTGWHLGSLEYSAVISALLLTALIYFSSSKNQYLRLTCSILMFALTVLLFVHKVPGFHNVKVWDGVQFSTISAPYTMFLNFDKPLFGTIFLLFFSHQLTFKPEWKLFLEGTLKSLLPLLIIIIPVGITINFIAFEPKFNSSYWLWAANDLLLVCVGEEVFFRGFIQHRLCNFLASKWENIGQWAGLLISSVIFGAAHFAGGLGYAFLSTVAGFFYGYTYKETRTIESAILVHFALNSVHFLFFTYPFLKISV